MRGFGSVSLGSFAGALVPLGTAISSERDESLGSDSEIASEVRLDADNSK